MSHCISNIIAIRTGGVFSGDVDMKDITKTVNEVMEWEDYFNKTNWKSCKMADTFKSEKNVKTKKKLK